jgi:ketosteroid isomerase-like protein
MSEENVAVVRAIYARWERADFSEVDWSDPDIEFATPDSPESVAVTGREAMGRAWARFLAEWDEFSAEPEEYLDAGEKVVVLTRFGGRGRLSGASAKGLPGASVMTFRDGRVVRLAAYTDRDRALAEAGLTMAAPRRSPRPRA